MTAGAFPARSLASTSQPAGAKHAAKRHSLLRRAYGDRGRTTFAVAQDRQLRGRICRTLGNDKHGLAAAKVDDRRAIHRDHFVADREASAIRGAAWYDLRDARGRKRELRVDRGGLTLIDDREHGDRRRAIARCDQKSRAARSRTEATNLNLTSGRREPKCALRV